MEITRTSIISGNISKMDLDVTPEQIARFESGVFVQDAFPHLTPDEREFILNGITPEEWHATFGDG